MRLRLAALSLLPLAACSGGNGSTDTTTNQAIPQHQAAATPAPAGQQWTDVVVKTPEGGYRMGNPNAQVKVVEYGSRLCPACGAFGQTGMQPLEKQYVATGRVSYEFRDYAVHGASDFGPTMLGRCVGEAAFFPVLEQMFIDQPTLLAKEEQMQSDQALATKLQNATPLQTATVFADYLGYVDWMKRHGLSEQAARACLADPNGLKAITDLTARGNSDGVTSTPTFMINGKQTGAGSWPQLEPMLKQAGA